LKDTIPNKDLTNTKHYLLNDFISIIERKGYTWEFLEETKKKQKVEKYEFTTRKEGTSKSKVLLDEFDNIDTQQYDRLIEKQKDGELIEGETYILDIHFMSKKFNIENCNKEIRKDYIHKHIRTPKHIKNVKDYEEKLNEFIEQNE